MTDLIPKFLEEYPLKPGGSRWRQVELDVALGRASGMLWEHLAQKTDYQQATIEGYTARDWWDTAYMWFLTELSRQQTDREREEAKRERQEWRERDKKLKRLGVELALKGLIEVMQGKRPRDEVYYRSLLSKGIAKDVAEHQARMNGRMPTPADIIWASKEFLAATGYSTANTELAKLAIEQERKAKELLGGGEGIDVDVSINDSEPGE